jgi:hypothetical protein
MKAEWLSSLGGAAASLPADAEAGVPPVHRHRSNQGVLTPLKGWGF